MTRFALVSMAGVVWWLSRLQATAVGWGLGAFHPWGLVLHNLLYPIILLALFIGLISETTWISRLLSSWFFELLGKSSYVFFLIHYTSIAGLIKKMTPDSYILFFLSVNVVSVLVYWFFERPISRVLLNILDRVYTIRLNVRGFFSTLLSGKIN